MRVVYFFLAALLSLILVAGSPLELAADSDSTRNLLKEGLLGAGAGAVGGAASGAKGKDLWKGALAGAGVNVVGGALLDSLSGEKVENVKQVDASTSRDAYSGGYEEGYRNGYKAGYTEGYRDGANESYKREK